jgi:hypothetical protein
MARNLSLADKLALIYTSAGSQRNVAALTGLSHQKVGRILKGQYAPGSKVLSDPDIRAAIDVALSIHTDIARAQARRDGLPFNAEFPVYYARLPFKVFKKVEVIDRRTGELVEKRVPVIDPATGKQKVVRGDRIAAQSTHWLSNDLRNAWIAATVKTKKFYAASVGSFVNLKKYNAKADASFRGKERTEKQQRWREQLKAREAAQKSGELDSAPIFTKYVAVGQDGFSPLTAVRNIEDQLRQKHEPATGEPGTFLAQQILLQFDTRRMEPPRREAAKTRIQAPRKKAPRKPR